MFTSRVTPEAVPSISGDIAQGQKQNDGTPDIFQEEKAEAAGKKASKEVRGSPNSFSEKSILQLKKGALEGLSLGKRLGKHLGDKFDKNVKRKVKNTTSLHGSTHGFFVDDAFTLLLLSSLMNPRQCM